MRLTKNFPRIIITDSVIGPRAAWALLMEELGETLDHQSDETLKHIDRVTIEIRDLGISNRGLPED